MKKTLLRCWPLGLALVLSAQPARDSFRFTLTGDSIIDRRISVYDEPEYLQMFERIRGADAAFTNFEMLVHDFEFPGAPLSGGTYMGAPAWVLDELKWAGFRLFAAANNHSLDFGIEGLRSNLRALRQAGVVYAGIGENLGRARAPGYFDTRKGRVALIACASTFSVLSPAGVQRPDMPGRPGLNPLRFKTTYTLDPAAFASIKSLASTTNQGESSPSRTADEVRFLGATFKSGDKTGVQTEPDTRDLKEISAQVREARREADWVVVSSHTHEGAPGSRESPAAFLVTFAHAMIDAGADLFVGHGPHILRGIEIYKGKPIFYSLANFIFQNETIAFQPQENYDQLNLPLTASTADYFDARSAKDTRSFPAEQKVWEAVIADAVFGSRHELQEILLHPITLGFGQSRTQRGRPLPATGELASSIIDRVARLSKPMGTTVSFEGGKGVVSVHAREF